MWGWLKSIFSSDKPNGDRRQEAAPAENDRREETPDVGDKFLNKLQKQLEADEGVKYEIYLDHLGLPTFGIGHLVTESDPEYGQPVGTAVSKERVDEAFKQDIQTSLSDCRALFADWDNLPKEVKLITANMAFNLGRRRLSKFQRMIGAVDAANWKKAAAEMKDSRWYKQVTNRADRLVKRMEAVV